jgi:hypothetical protein
MVLFTCSISLTLARYCSTRPKPLDPDEEILNLRLPKLRRFMHWCLATSNMKTLNSAYSIFRFFRQAYKMKTLREMEDVLVSEMTSV